MIFNNFYFIFLFLPITLFLFYNNRLKESRSLILITASFIFYGLNGLEHVFILFFDILWVYIFTSLKNFRNNKSLLIACIAIPCLNLFYYKYLGFLFNDILNINLPEDGKTFSLFSNIILPAGISFFTFQLISFSVDKFKNDIKENLSLEKLFLYISFFPQLVAGPIVRYSNVKKIITNIKIFKLENKNLKISLIYIIYGLFLKVVLADGLANFINPLKSDMEILSIIPCLYIIFAYSFQIYFDFYGYSLIALGLGKLFGFNLPQNFNNPYKTLNPKEFWKCWHITLSNWIKDYIYIPLGGKEKYLRNIFLIFLFCGLWHGAGFNFIIWGLFHGFYIIIYKTLQKKWDNLHDSIQIFLNFFIVSFVWTLFLFDFPDLKNFFSNFFKFHDNGLFTISFFMWLFLIFCYFFIFKFDFEKFIRNKEILNKNQKIIGIVMAIIFFITLTFLGNSGDFIYFKF